MKEIRNLTADEIEVRVQSLNATNKGCVLLIYKDARCDQKILDETFGAENWMRSHQEVNGNLFCSVSIWDDEKKQWISKQDAGKESNTEKEKGHASDSFKRACVNWGIGRELYTAPFLYVKLEDNEIQNGKLARSVEFSVKEIEYDGKEITKIIIQDSFNKVRCSFPRNSAPNEQKPKEKTEVELIAECSDKIEKCTSMEELFSIWKDYRTLQSHDLIILKKDNKKAELLAKKSNEETNWMN